MKSKLLTLCGICSAFALLCQLGASYLVYVGFAFSLISSIMVCVPALVNPRYFYWSLLTYAASTVLGIVLGASVNPVSVLLSAVFMSPFALLKLFCESEKKVEVVETKNVTVDSETERLFGFDEKQSVRKTPNKVTRVSGWLRWVVYYVYLEVALVVFGLLLKLFAPNLFENERITVFIIIVAALANLALPLYSKMLNGLFTLVRKYAKGYDET